MKRKLFSMTIVLAAVAALALPMLARDLGYVKVSLGITGSGTDFVNVTITNATGKAIPKGTKVYWYFKGCQGNVVLQADMAPGKTVQDSGEFDGIQHANEAYYLKPKVQIGRKANQD